MHQQHESRNIYKNKQMLLQAHLDLRHLPHLRHQLCMNVSVLPVVAGTGKNVVLSGIGTDRPARRRPAALDRPGTPGRARARRAPAGVRDDMN